MVGLVAKTNLKTTKCPSFDNVLTIWNYFYFEKKKYGLIRACVAGRVPIGAVTNFKVP